MAGVQGQFTPQTPRIERYSNADLHLLQIEWCQLFLIISRMGVPQRANFSRTSCLKNFS